MAPALSEYRAKLVEFPDLGHAGSRTPERVDQAFVTSLIGEKP
jgi:hypothetical protein